MLSMFRALEKKRMVSRSSTHLSPFNPSTIQEIKALGQKAEANPLLPPHALLHGGSAGKKVEEAPTAKQPAGDSIAKDAQPAAASGGVQPELSAREKAIRVSLHVLPLVIPFSAPPR